ncbi:hypothetical protein BDP27DRAFT_1371685 [Rhodocollybia butyracea]|uniref:Uncharacterized protein n=1 Tax=Rhodocollybia butyracea TaxID=206335 RepID=A0A9P5PBV2_9AGAR|nr:hypothetical protein BDP27DRAFT_1371685 [Rhodocollybia butyracea]
MGAAVVNSEEGFREVWTAELPLEKRMFCQYPFGVGDLVLVNTSGTYCFNTSLFEVERYFWTSIRIQEAEIEGREEDASLLCALGRHIEDEIKDVWMEKQLRGLGDPRVLDAKPTTTRKTTRCFAASEYAGRSDYGGCAQAGKGAGVREEVDLDLEDGFRGPGSGGAEGFSEASVLTAIPSPVVVFYGIYLSPSS